MAWDESTERKGSLRQGPHAPGAPLPAIPLGTDWENCPDMAVGSLRQGSRAGASGFTTGQGAGRMVDATFPPTFNQATFNGPRIDIQSRFGMVQSPLFVAAGFPGDAVGQLYKGRACLAFRSNGGGLMELGGSNTIRLDVPRETGGPKDKGDLACWRIKAILAFAPAGSGDLGLELTRGTDGHVILQNGAGFALRPGTDNIVMFYSRPVAGFPYGISDPCPARLDVTEWNCYEFRLIGATDVNEAVLRVLVNGEVQFTYGLDEATMPQSLTLMPRIIARASGTCYVAIGGVNISAGPDERSML